MIKAVLLGWDSVETVDVHFCMTPVRSVHSSLAALTWSLGFPPLMYKAIVMAPRSNYAEVTPSQYNRLSDNPFISQRHPIEKLRLSGVWLSHGSLRHVRYCCLSPDGDKVPSRLSASSSFTWSTLYERATAGDLSCWVVRRQGLTHYRFIIEYDTGVLIESYALHSS